MNKNRDGISYFITFQLFNICFFCLQLLYVYSQTESFTHYISFPWNSYFEWAKTLGAHLLLYFLLSLVQTFLLIGVLNRAWHYFSSDHWLILIWTLSVCAIISLNNYYFPLSMFSKISAPPLTPSIFLVLAGLTSSVLGVLLINSLVQQKALLLLMILVTLTIYLMGIDNRDTKRTNNSLPNIIILGIDSLNPEEVTKSKMPFLSALLHQSVQFSNTISPLARTYPAWASILTGLYAHHHLAEENLIAKNQVQSQFSIAWILDGIGYETIYATDDRRFNSIDKDFGFKHVIGPKLGVNDALLGTYNDFPLSNLLINFKVSAILFPYNYSNRASFFSYYPQTFNEKLRSQLVQLPSNKPLLLAVHFTLPHWPYAWAQSLPEEVNNEYSLLKRDNLYKSALRRVDAQFASFFNFLKDNKYLNNSLVIILSDHGETLYNPGSRLTNLSNYQGTLPSKLVDYFKNNTATELNRSAGHGSDILSPGQYRSILAFKIYKNGELTTPSATIEERVALIDIAPTILEYLQKQISSHNDGISLLNMILTNQNKLPQRAFFIESGMFPNQEITSHKALEIGKKFFQVNEATGELELKPQALKIIAKQKLYGVIEGDWVLALYPTGNNYISVIQNLKTGFWSDDLDSIFTRNTPILKLKRKLDMFYGATLSPARESN